MVRTQIQLTEKQAERLRRIAADRRQSVAEIIRTGVEMFLSTASEPVNRFERAKSVVGRFSSGLGDVSEKHDEYLSEAFGNR